MFHSLTFTGKIKVFCISILFLSFEKNNLFWSFKCHSEFYGVCSCFFSSKIITTFYFKKNVLISEFSRLLRRKALSLSEKSVALVGFFRRALRQSQPLSSA